MKAAIYARSSKDRSDISIATQVHELRELAKRRGVEIAAVFEDAVESGSSDDRPAFNELVREVRNPRRGWGEVLVFDTSRVARRRHISLIFEEVECRRAGVKVVYKSLPDSDPITEMLLKSILQAMDEWHSMTSRAKGLAGMAQNVRSGFRAGGRPPLGYRLDVLQTGAMREGRPVTKSRLVPDARAGELTRYLKARATGVARRKAGPPEGCRQSSLNGIEWNALTYAGHTVWNVHREEGVRRRPRAEWVVQKDTHPALITEAEAESILAQLERGRVDIGAAVAEGRRALSDALLAGILFTSDGQAWSASGAYYRLRPSGKTVRRDLLEKAVIEQVIRDSESDEYLTALLEAAREHRAAAPRPAELEIRRLEKEKARAAQLAVSGDDAFIDVVAQKSRQIEALRREQEALEREDSLGQHLSALTPDALRRLLAAQDPARRVETLVERVTLEPDLTCRLLYRSAPGVRSSVSCASPRGSERSAMVREITIAARAA